MFSPEKSALIIVDVQGKLAEMIHDKEVVYGNIQTLIKTAKLLNIPILWTEQLPEKIGPTIPLIKDMLTDLNPIIKASFSCFGEDSFVKALRSLYRKQLIIAGIETHVCIYQTAADLVNNGYKVQVVADAVSSRKQQDKMLAIDRMKVINCELTSTEMLITELIRTAHHEKFRDIIQLMK